MKIKATSITLYLLLACAPALVFCHDSQSGGADSDVPMKTVYMTAAERDAVLSEMRQFLQSTADIVKGITEEDMDQVAASARKSGRAASAHMPKTLHKKLPASFRKLGGDTHRRFDQLALDAEQLGDEGHALSQLGALLNNCVSCHASFRIEAK